MNLTLYGQLIFDKGGRNIKWSKNSLFIKWGWEIWTATWKKMKFDYQLMLHKKTNSSWVKDLYISHNTKKVLEESTSRKIWHIPHSNIFIDMFPQARDIKERINKWELIKIKSFCMAKEYSTRIQREPTVWENNLPMIPQTRSWSPKYIKNSHNSTPGRQTTQLKNGQKTGTDTSPRKTYRGPRDIWKDAQHH